MTDNASHGRTRIEKKMARTDAMISPRLRYLLAIVTMVFIIKVDVAEMAASSSYPLPRELSTGMDMPSEQFNEWGRDPGLQGTSMGPVRVIVRLRTDRLEPIRPAAGKGKKAKKAFLIKQLRDFTQKRAAKLVQKLSRMRGKDKQLRGWKNQYYSAARSLWLANAVAMTVDANDIEELLQDPDVADVVPNMTLSIPPVLAVSASGNSADGSSQLWNHERIGLDYLHQQGLDGTGIRIGTLDTGVDHDHPELQGKISDWQEFDALGNSVTSQPHETNNVAHGTHVASILVGEQTGIAPRAELLCALVLPDGHGTTEQVISGMQWVLDPDGDPDTDDGAQIINMSWGMAGTSAVLEAAIESLVAAGVLPVAAIGNDGRDSTYSPGNLAACIGVGAVNMFDNAAAFSGGGQVCRDGFCINKPDVSAPGVNIYGAAFDGEYQYLSGTSMASPHVAGSAALLWQYDALLTLPQLTRFLTQSTVDLGFYGMDPRFGWGRLDARSAVAFLDLYAGRLGAADLVLTKVVSTSRGSFYCYYTYFNDGHSAFLIDDFDMMLSFSASENVDIEALGAGDVDGDGYADLITRVVSPLGNELFRMEYVVHPSRGAYSFAGFGNVWHTFETADPDAYKLIGISDVNGDLKDDLVLSWTASSGENQGINIFAMVSDGSGFQLSTEEVWLHIDDSNVYRYDFGTGDVDGDGRADLIVTKTYNSYKRYYNTYCYVALSDAERFKPLADWLTLRPAYPYSPIEQFFYADVNGDGATDLLFTDQVTDWQGLATRRLHTSLSNGSDGFLKSKIWAEIDGVSMPVIVDLKDVNGDGAGDAVILYSNSNSNAKSVWVWLSDWKNNRFDQCETSWFVDPAGILSSDRAKVVGVANVGLGTWGNSSW